MPGSGEDSTGLPVIEVAVARGEKSGLYSQTYVSAQARLMDPAVSDYTRARTTWGGKPGVVVTWTEVVPLEGGDQLQVEGIDLMVQIEQGVIARVSGYARAGQLDERVMNVVRSLQRPT